MANIKLIIVFNLIAISFASGGGDGKTKDGEVDEEIKRDERAKNLWMARYHRRNFDALLFIVYGLTEVHKRPNITGRILTYLNDDVYSAWTDYVNEMSSQSKSSENQQQEQVSKKSKDFSVFGLSELSSLKRNEDLRCVANLYINSLNEGKNCDPKRYTIIDHFVSCWTYEIRRTRIVQSLIWRMLKTVEYCRKQDKSNKNMLDDLRNRLVEHDTSDVEQMDKQLHQMLNGKKLDANNGKAYLADARHVITQRQQDHQQSWSKAKRKFPFTG